MLLWPASQDSWHLTLSYSIVTSPLSWNSFLVWLEANAADTTFFKDCHQRPAMALLHAVGVMWLVMKAQPQQYKLSSSTKTHTLADLDCCFSEGTKNVFSIEPSQKKGRQNWRKKQSEEQKILLGMPFHGAPHSCRGDNQISFWI